MLNFFYLGISNTPPQIDVVYNIHLCGIYTVVRSVRSE
jgi:hypothetical protein